MYAPCMRFLRILAALAALPVAAACGSLSKSPGALGDQGDDASSHAKAGSSGGEAGMHDASEGSAGEGGAAAPWVLGYFSSWDSQTNGGSYPVSAIDWDGLTHIATAFYIPDGTGGWASGSFDDATATAIITAAQER